MKSLLIFFTLLLSQHIFSQNLDWVQVNPNPQNDFYAIKFFNQNTGYVVGSGGIILKNTTGSNNWVTIPSGTVNDLYSMYFFDINHGYIVGAGGLIMYTSDGGNNWTHLVTSNGYALRSITFVNQNTGFIVGDNGELYKTTTGTFGWIPITVTAKNLSKVVAADSLHIFACGDSGKFLRTTNGGINWMVSSISTANLIAMSFPNALTGFISANLNPSYKTTDGGATWNTISGNWGNTIYSIKFINNNTGFIAGENGPIRKTTDGGTSWATWCSGQLFWGNSFRDISAIDSGHAFICGTRGWILKSIDTGSVYNNQYSVAIGGCRYTLSSISFINENTGEVLGNNEYLYTTNAGVNWTPYLVGSNSWFEGSSNITEVRLFAPSSGYRVMYYPGVGGPGFYALQNSTDAGLTWNGTRTYGTMYFGFSGYTEIEGVTYLSIYKTVLKNSGSGWSTSDSSAYGFGSISFANANTGLVVGGGPVQGVSSTTNGGANWTFVPSGNFHQISRVYILPSGVGYLAGDSSFIMKTTNSGANWTLISSGGNQSILDIKFANNNVGWYLGQSGPYPYTGRLFYTGNGGANFVQMQSLMNFNVNGFSFIDANTGYVCGDSSIVLKTTNGGLTFVNPSLTNLPETYSLSQNYPNPFNPVTKINFAIPGVGSGRDRSVKLIIYDVLGREVAILINQQMQPGNYSVDWDGTNYPSGVYFYKIAAGDYSESKKMILIK